MGDQETQETWLAEVIRLRAYVVELEDAVRLRQMVEMQREQAGPDLACTQVLFQAAVEQAAAGMLIAGAPDGRIRLVNAAGLGIRGHTEVPLIDIPFELHPQHWQIYYPDGTLYRPEDLPLARAISRGDVVRGEQVIIRRDDGDLRWSLVSAAPVYDAQGNIIAGIVVFPDVTRYVQAQEERNLFFDLSMDMLSIGDFDGHLRQINRAWTKTLGWTEEELTTRPWIDFIHPDDRLKSMRAAQAMQNGESSFTMENRYLCRDGSVRWLSWNSIPIPEKRIVFSAVRDITTQRAAEDALRESEARYRAIVEDQSEFIVRWKPDGECVFVNQVYARFWELPPEALIGTHFLFSLPPQDRSAIRAQVAGLTVDRPAVTQVRRLARPNGMTSWQEWTDRAIFDAAGKVFEIQSIGRDVTERVRAEQLLQALNRAALAMASAVTQDEILTAMADELCALDLFCMVLMADERRERLFARYMSYNPTLPQLLETAAGMPVQELSMPIALVDHYRRVFYDRESLLVDDITPVVELLLPHLQRGQAESMVQQMHTRRSIEAPLVVEEQVIGIFAVLADHLIQADIPAVTAFSHQLAAALNKAALMQNLQNSLRELEHTQDRLIQAQKMEAVGRLAGGVAHDFNNYLTAITGYVDLLLLSFQPNDPLRADLEQIQKAAARSTSLTRQLLAFSRKQVLQPRVIDLNALISDMERMLRPLIGEHIHLVAQLDPGLGHTHADPGQIEQVILNLALNARDAMPGGGQLVIQTANVELDESDAASQEVQAGPYVRLVVSDTGMGMDDEVLAHVFEPFFTTKEQGQGVGLGLATVFGIVRQSGGTIRVSSTLGQGSSFVIDLPRIRESPAPAEPDKPVRAARGSETILLVEDEASVRGLVRRVLERSGYTVLEADSADAAIALGAGYRAAIDLVLTDVIMPGQASGQDIVERLAGDHPGLKVLYMSGYTDDMIGQHGVLEPGIAFIHKPFTPAFLSQKVRQVLDS